MDSTAVISAILTLIAGIGIFLTACTMMSSNIEAVSSSKLKELFSKASRSKMLGVVIGTVGTAAIQSSGATTVMVIGFVNAGIMSLVQAATIIYGANIGTTVTGQIVALGMFGGNSVSTTVIFSAMAGIGAFITAFSKADITKRAGGIIAGFGMLFVGLHMMSSSMECFAQLESVKNYLASISNIFLLVIIGAIMTAIIQSSSVMTSVAITMVVASLISLEQGIYLTMGSNIGSCVVSLMAGATSGTNAKRTSLIHLFFNVSGVILFVALGMGLSALTQGTLTYGTIFSRFFPHAPQTQLAMFHTVFNVLTVIFVFPLTDYLVNFVIKLVPDREAQGRDSQELQPRLFFINDHMLNMPAVAVQQAKNEIVNMAAIAMRNFSLACHIVCTLDFKDIERFQANEKELDYLNKEIVRYLVKVSNRNINARDHAYLATAFHSVTDLERVGDYAENIVEYAERLKAENETFSSAAIAEINDTLQLIRNLYSKVMEAYVHENKQALDEAYEIEEIIDEVTKDMALRHIQRLNDGECTPDVGSQYMSIASNAERVADHFINVGKAIKQYT
ncbi:MAG: Na/Pi cotransporter family protein [bacterium]|nr:Na/Pi cotransporter family protein [bacterium]